MKQQLKEATLGLAFVDAIPVLLFGISMGLIFTMFPSYIFAVGAIICTLAGLSKVIWKLILAIKKKNIDFLYKAFVPMMAIGFLIIIVSVIVSLRNLSLAKMWKNVSTFPCSVFFLVSIIAFVVMIILAIKMDLSTIKANWIEQVCNIFAQLGLLLGVVIIVYAHDYYSSTKNLSDVEKEHSNVTITEINNGLFFDGPSKDKALVFYQGAKVEYTAYAELMSQIAEEGMDCFLLELPYNMAILDVNAAESVMNSYNYDEWYLGGHSLGGVAASTCASKNSEQIDGVLFLASYATKDMSETDLKILSIYGSEDAVLKIDSMEQADSLMPKEFKKECIKGGNHAGFGNYGKQKGDGEASISDEEQKIETVKLIRDFFIDK